MSYGYDEGQVLAFIGDADAAYAAAGQAWNSAGGVWVARMQFDAVTMSYPPARAKHLTTLKKTLPETVPPPAGATRAAGYDEGQVLAFIADCDAAYAASSQDWNSAGGVWIARMQWDAIPLGYPVARRKHLAALNGALGTPPPVTPPGAHVDPSTIPLETLARIRGSMWTARLDVAHGPRPGDPTNILALEYLYCYPPDEQLRMIEAYKARGYTHACIGPCTGPGYHGHYPDVSFVDNFDAFLDVVQLLWDHGLTPIFFVWDSVAWPTVADLEAVEHLFTSERAQRLLRVVVPAGWEPDRQMPSTEWRAILEWGARVFPNALRLIHMVTDHDAPGSGSEGIPNDQLWNNVIHLIHVWIVQSALLFEPDTVNENGQTNLQVWVDSYDIRVRGSYPDRFVNGYANWPGHSAWGPDTPIVIIAGEYLSFPTYWKNRREAESQQYGDAAMAVGAAGYLDGGTVHVP